MLDYILATKKETKLRYIVNIKPANTCMFRPFSLIKQSLISFIFVLVNDIFII